MAEHNAEKPTDTLLTVKQLEELGNKLTDIMKAVEMSNLALEAIEVTEEEAPFFTTVVTTTQLNNYKTEVKQHEKVVTPLKNRGYYRRDFSPIFIKKRIMRTAKAYNANSKSV